MLRLRGEVANARVVRTRHESILRRVEQAVLVTHGDEARILEGCPSGLRCRIVIHIVDNDFGVLRVVVDAVNFRLVA